MLDSDSQEPLTIVVSPLIRNDYLHVVGGGQPVAGLLEVAVTQGCRLPSRSVTCNISGEIIQFDGQIFGFSWELWFFPGNHHYFFSY